MGFFGVEVTCSKPEMLRLLKYIENHRDMSSSELLFPRYEIEVKALVNIKDDTVRYVVYIPKYLLKAKAMSDTIAAMKKYGGNV